MPKPNWNAQLYENNHAFVWQYGEDVVQLLAPQPKEQILDLGCGTGHLTAKIAASGAKVVGMDADVAMIEQAKQNYPELEFVIADAQKFRFDRSFDAVFSNATLHWVRDPEAAIQCIERALKPAGRLVAEFGGKGNIQTILQAIDQALNTIGQSSQRLNPWYFPSISEYTNLLEKNGFEVSFAVLFDRPTLVEDQAGLVNWLEMFANCFFTNASAQERSNLLIAIENNLRPVLYQDGSWILDYRRLRVLATKRG